MQVSLESEIYEQLSQFVMGEQSLVAFQRWFLPASWNVHKSGDDRLQSLVGEIGLMLAEHDAGHRTEDEVRTLAQELTTSRPTETRL